MRTVLATNVFGVVTVMQALIPLFRKAINARIVNVSSGFGSLTLMRNPENPYRNNFELVCDASKTVLNGITVAFVDELEAENVKASAVSPGFTATVLNNFKGTDTAEKRIARADTHSFNYY